MIQTVGCHWRALLLWGLCATAHAQGCGEVLSLPTHDNTQTRVAWVPPRADVQPRVTLVLLAGGSGYLNLGPDGCARQLQGNSLVRSQRLFQAEGLGTAVVDAPSDHHGEDGLGGFRMAPEHAQDLGAVVAELRRRTSGAVWIVGTSRGAISAAGAASRLSGDAAPDGVVLTSAVMAGQAGARKAWVAQSVFDAPLEQLRMPLLLLGHVDDSCVRSPPALMPQVAARVRSERQQVATLTGGAGLARASGADVCEGRSPHGFNGQEAEMVQGITRFVRGGRF